ncbi:hypothetical protein [Rhizobacter sp. LjRoot28]|jgi:hypothetical protein|uniref:hypothetical protein n=1 Tax=Rhizobacter sp. LjRoot28 TaxID=3342309 RepID=UPI003ECCE3A9
MASKNLPAVALAAAGGALASLGAALALGFGIGGATAVAQPAGTPALTLLTPPACTCSEAVSAAGGLLQNCSCGALQCVVAGNKSAVAPALTCVK